MERHAADQTVAQAPAAVPIPEHVTASGAAVALVPDEDPQGESMRVLFFGFGTGLTIAFVFLIYIVLAYSGVLP